MENFEYVGKELELFEIAINWKNYWLKSIKPFLGTAVLEVGAGIGGNTQSFNPKKFIKWIALEPDKHQCDVIKQKIQDKSLPANVQVFNSTIADLYIESTVDSVLYIDVLEHIENDRLELIKAKSLLQLGGKIIILAPAHNFLFSPFDTGVGHFRRYNKKMLRQIVPTGMVIKKICYLDSVGFFASFINKVFLKQSLPSVKQILFWDRFLVRLSFVIDKLLLFNFGKTILMVIEKEHT